MYNYIGMLQCPTCQNVIIVEDSLGHNNFLPNLKEIMWQYTTQMVERYLMGSEYFYSDEELKYLLIEKPETIMFHPVQRRMGLGSSGRKVWFSGILIPNTIIPFNR
jgi:hypothetical protein